jgi:hypothetical protein
MRSLVPHRLLRERAQKISDGKQKIRMQEKEKLGAPQAATASAVDTV